MNYDIIQEQVQEDHRVQPIRKQIWDGRDFQPMTYYRLPLARQDREPAQRWLQDQFGPAQELRTWWPVSGNIFMTQQIYTWWCLAHGLGPTS
jgi:hypothetical protein